MHKINSFVFIINNLYICVTIIIIYNIILVETIMLWVHFSANTFLDIRKHAKIKFRLMWYYYVIAVNAHVNCMSAFEKSFSNYWVIFEKIVKNNETKILRDNIPQNPLFGWVLRFVIAFKSKGTHSNDTPHWYLYPLRNCSISRKSLTFNKNSNKYFEWGLNYLFRISN